MKRNLKLLVMGLAAAVVLPAAAVTEAIAFHGFVDDGSAGSKAGKMLTLDFKLYSSEGQEGELLWARRIPVSLDENGGFYVDITDSIGQRYQATDGRVPVCDTLAAALAYHARDSKSPIWISYEPVDGKVVYPPPRQGLYYQPVAVRAKSAGSVMVAEINTVTAGVFTAQGPLIVNRLVSMTPHMSFAELKLLAPENKAVLNESGSVRIGDISGFRSYSATNAVGGIAARLPKKADGDCGRVIRYTLPNGQETHATCFYALGDDTTPPTDSTTIYIWTFGKLEGEK